MYEEVNNHTGQVRRYSREQLVRRLQVLNIANHDKVMSEIDDGAEHDTDHATFRQVRFDLQYMKDYFSRFDRRLEAA